MTVKSISRDQIANRAKRYIKQTALRLAQAIGRYRPFTAAELAAVQVNPVSFTGDLPRCAGDEYNQYRLEFKQPRPRQESIQNLLYTSRGMGWCQGVLYERYSMKEPAIADLRHPPTVDQAIRVPAGVVVQVETPYSYGDWVSEHLIAITSAMPLAAPLYLPSQFLQKSYVRRDLANLGIEAIAVEQPILIERATVIHKTRPSHYVTEAEVAAFRRAAHVPEITPRPGSIIYLSRQGIKSESPATQGAGDRVFPSDITHAVMESLGAKIILTKDMSYEGYCAISPEAETVIADFGAALANLLLWRPKNLIVLFTEDWWDGFCLFLAKALGITNVVMIKADGISETELRQRLEHYLHQFNVPYVAELQELQQGDQVLRF